MRLPRISRKFTGILTAIFILAALGIFGAFSPAHADQTVPSFIASALASIAQVLIELVGKILIVLIQILLAIVQYNDFINAPAVVKTWVLVRDLGNMAFLVIFIAIAFATILGIEKYEYKQLLPKLLLMAVLINFSRTICGLIIDAAQVVMMTFVNGFKEVASGNLIRGFGLTDMLNLRDLGKQESGISDSALAAASILAVVLLLIATVTVGIIVLMFLIRVIYLWILVALSPAAFLLAAAPGMSGKFGEWWSQFTRYVIIGPVMAFFLWMSLSIMSSVKPGENLAQSSNISFGSQVNSASTVTGVDTRVSATITEIGRADNLLSYGMAIALLLLSLTVAQEIGVKGGALAGSALAKIQSGGIKLGKLAGLTVATGGLGTAAALAGAYKGRKLAGKGAWEAIKYWNQKRYAAGGKNLDIKQAWKGWKEKFQDTKRRDIILGEEAAGKLMRDGGAVGLFYGGTGAGRDFMEWYGHGFAGTNIGMKEGQSGGIVRAWRTVFGSPQAALELEEKVKEEKRQEEEAKQKSRLYKEASETYDYSAQGKEAYVEENLKAEQERILQDLNANGGKRPDQMVTEHGQQITHFQALTEFMNAQFPEFQGRLPDYMINTPEKIRASKDDGGNEDVKMAEKKEEFNKEWAGRKARNELEEKVDSALSRDGKQKDQEDIIKAVHKLGQQRLDKQITEKAAEITRLESGGLSDIEIKGRNKDLESISQRMAKTLEDIKRNMGLGLSVEGPQNDYLKMKEEAEKLGGSFAESKEKVSDNRGFQWEIPVFKIKGTFGAGKSTDDVNAFNLDKFDYKSDYEKDAANKLASARTPEERKKVRNNLAEVEKKRSDMKKAVEDEREKLALLREAPTWDAAKRQEVADKIKGFDELATQHHNMAEITEDESRKYQKPSTFYAARNRRALEEEEMRKITSELDSELLADVKGALAEGNVVKGMALVKKLAKDANDNELWNEFGFTSDMKGMHDFFNAVVIGDKNVTKADGTLYTGPSFGVDKQTAYSVENDVSFINEGVNHWETARLMKIENGMYKQMTSLEHTAAALAEIMKKDPTDVIRNFNRLAYGGEKPRSDGSGKRDFEMSLLGLSILNAFGPEFRFRYGRSEFNKNAVMNIAKVLDTLSQYGISQDYINLTRGKAKTLPQGPDTNIDSIVNRLFQLVPEKMK